MRDTFPGAQQHQRADPIMQLGGIQDTIKGMRRSLERHELRKKDARSHSPVTYPTSQQAFGQTNQGYPTPNVSLPPMDDYIKEELKTKLLELYAQPSIKTTLASSAYMRSIREQTLR